MGLTYNPTTKKWNLVSEEATQPTYLPAPDQIKIWALYDRGFYDQSEGPPEPYSTVRAATESQTSPGEGWEEVGTLPVTHNLQDLNNFLSANISGLFTEPQYQDLRNTIARNARSYFENKQINQQKQTDFLKEEARNAIINNASYSVLGIVNSTAGGDYVQQRDRIRNLPGLDDTTKQRLEDYYKIFYRTEKLQRWDEGLGAKPQYGDFDPKYYKSINPDIAEKWKFAVANDDIDITERYSEGSYYLQHYTNQGKPAGMRGNAAEETTAANQYLERKPTDADIQAARNIQLGVNTDTQTDRLLAVPAVAAEWEKAKQGDAYWKSLAKEKLLDPSKPDEFAALFRLSKRPEDQQTSFTYNLNAGYGITELEDAVNQAVGTRAIVDVKKFGALTQNVLKDTIEEMKKAKQKEQMLGLISGFGSFGEIANINKDISNMILGDSGVGGILSFAGGNKAQESLEKSLQGITGINNNVTYNWQQWFDNTLKEKYNKEIELGYSTDEAKETVKVDAEFARNFIDKYLNPRFNTSRSISEFTEYLDVRQKEQNPFQTQDMLNAVTQVANLRADKYLSDVQNTPDRFFNADFYFNPTGDKARVNAYSEQAKTVSEDWEKAKAGDGYWASQAYRFGIDLNNKEQFAKMHYQIKGRGVGYDPAEDVLNAGKVQDEIYNKILPSLKDEALKQGTVFGQFITPEEFTDKMLEGLDPTDKSTWQEALKSVGLNDFKGTIDEFKDYVSEALRTGTAQTIREQIKYLNEKGEKPTQEKLGVEYIERPEDYKQDQIKSETQLYKTFQQAGYKGTEDEFYTKFFPDTDRTEQQLLTKAGTGTNLKLKGLDFSDPFASLSTVQGFFGDEDQDSTDSSSEKESDIFGLGLDEESNQYKSKTGSQILGEFTSMFKGF